MCGDIKSSLLNARKMAVWCSQAAYKNVALIFHLSYSQLTFGHLAGCAKLGAFLVDIGAAANEPMHPPIADPSMLLSCCLHSTLASLFVGSKLGASRLLRLYKLWRSPYAHCSPLASLFVGAKLGASRLLRYTSYGVHLMFTAHLWPLGSWVPSLVLQDCCAYTSYGVHLMLTAHLWLLGSWVLRLVPQDCCACTSYDVHLMLTAHLWPLDSRCQAWCPVDRGAAANAPMHSHTLAPAAAQTA